MFGMFAYIGGSSQVLIERFHFSPTQYGMLFGMSACMFIASSQVGPTLVRRFGTARLLRVATSVYLAGGLVVLVCAPARHRRHLRHCPADHGRHGLHGPHHAQRCRGRPLQPRFPRRQPPPPSGHAAIQPRAISGALVGLLSDGTARPLAALLVVGALAAITADRVRPKPALRTLTPAD